MPDCLTCAKSVEGDAKSFAICSNKEIQNALCKHFWFGENQYLKSTICLRCWVKIEDFHRFYCEVEELHSHQLFPHVQLLEIKEEQHARDVFAPEQPKSEDPSEDDDNDSERKPDIKEAAKRTRLQKNESDAVQEYVSQNLILDCDTCSKRCATFETLQNHSMMEHAKKATVLCCNLKFTSNYRFVNHVRFHLDQPKFECSKCSKQFDSRDTLKRHVRSTHGSEKEKPMSDVEEDETDAIKSEDPEPSEGESGADDANDDDEDYVQGSDDSEDSNNSGDDKADKSLQDESKLRRRTKETEKEMVKIQEYVSKNITLECDTCSERRTTFKDLLQHSKEKHGKPATIVCCNLKLMTCYRFDDHILYHLSPDRFECSQCSKKCPNREALSRHIQKAHTPAEDRLHSCQVCQKKFPTRYKLARHAETHDETSGKRRPVKDDEENEKLIADNITLECDTCQEKHDSFMALQKHSVAEHKKLAFVFCCDLKFNKKPRLVDHVLFHLDPTSFQCKICHKNLPHSESLKRHIEKNHAPEESRTIKCSMCPKMFTHQKFLSTHERYHNRRWHCEICDKRFICEATLKHHHKSIHTKELNYVCHVCARTFHIYSSYRSHLETHDESAKKKPPKPRVQCQICNTWTLKLSHHMRLHSGTRTCEICGKECRHLIAYRYHMKSHETGDFICTVCDKSFKRELGLKEHMASHTGDVLYSCDFCDRTFNSGANRASHRKKMHPQQWLEDKLMKKAAKMAQYAEPVQS
ncbi:PR domain zinc finger protein 5 [Aedes aegypti]|uniref:C2H2-type domain-containing protein n=1 Tax=Aedes aegypti TaxID=7159 RepID=A0A1S4G1U3_AEDAE|nr:PR domain zinc finger protein 5 [Aedes aegypti]XP_021693752.1 PR domain zinc finger protein 5 [Aedes aegypti]